MQRFDSGSSKTDASSTPLQRRFRFSIRGCGVDDLLVNAGAIRSAAVESANPGTLESVLFELGLTDYENVDYPRAVRRLTGLECWPRAPGEAVTRRAASTFERRWQRIPRLRRRPAPRV